MRILIHGINFSPELTGIGKYTGEMAEWMAAQGHEVRVVTAPPYYPQWRIADGYENRWGREAAKIAINPALKRPTNNVRAEPIKAHAVPFDKLRANGEFACSENMGSLVIYRCPLWVPSRPSGFKRLLHLASFALSSFPVMFRQIFWRPDVVWVVEPPLFCAPQAWLVARLSGGKAWLHIQDYEVDAAFALGMLKGAALRRLVAAGERWWMRRVDRVSSISLRMVDRAVEKGVMPERVVLFRNWVDITGLQTGGAAPSGYRAELGIAAEAVVALYSGNMGGKQGLEILAQAADLLRDVQHIVFVFCGNGGGRNELVAQCEGLPNVHFLDLQPVARLGELLAMADVHLLPQRADAADLVMPSKLTGMLASNRPVVATAHTGTKLAGVVTGCGLVVPPEDPKAFADAIMVLANDAAQRTRFGAAGRAYAEAHLDLNAVLGAFEEELRALEIEAETLQLLN